MSQCVENLTTSKVRQLLQELSQKEVFLCEKRAVYEFAKLLEQSGYTIFLEYPYKFDSKYVYEDIRVEAPNGLFVFEFKYCPSNIHVSHGIMNAKSRNKSSASKRFSDFFNDIHRTLQITKENSSIKKGFCIFITNQTNIIQYIDKGLEKTSLKSKWQIFKKDINKSKDLYLLLVPVSKNTFYRTWI